MFGLNIFLNNILSNTVYLPMAIGACLAVGLFFLYAGVLSRRQILLNLLAIYLAIIGSYWTLDNCALCSWGKGEPVSLNYYAVLFLVWWLVAIVVLWHSRLFSHSFERVKWWKKWLLALFSAVVQSGLILFFIYSFWPLPLNFKPSGFWADGQYRLWWLALSLVNIWFLRNPRKRPGRPPSL
jgi:hypothetical protein